MFYQWEHRTHLDRRHRPRTRNGCLTCRRRKVRCDEKRPDCGHCSRLGIACSWQKDADPSPGTRLNRTRKRQRPSETGTNQPLPEDRPDAGAVAVTTPSIENTISYSQNAAEESAFNRIFDFANFISDDSSPLSPSWPPLGMDSFQDLILQSDTWPPMQPTLRPINLNNSSDDTTVNEKVRPGVSPSLMPSLPPIGWSESQLVEYFARSAAPPILANVETNARWSWIRKEFISMTLTSRMVKSGVSAFVALELESPWSLEPTAYTQYYRNAKEKLRDCLKEINEKQKILTVQFRHVLTVTFLLSYIDLLTKEVSNAHANLRACFIALQIVDIESLGVTEKRLLSWLRLLDARAVSAGGEGLFLTEEDNPINSDLRSPDSAIEEVDENFDDAEAALEDFIMRPAFAFFQKVQFFMGRISKIDPWHRRRGTVEDETEVMLIAATISRDIKSLWQQRPPLMDHAVAGRLASLLPVRLAATITRTMRVYHANYYASFIHLHRVAYKSLPRTREVINAMNEICQVTRLLLESPRTSPIEEVCTIDSPSVSTTSANSLPVNMLWPLLMLGAEVEDPGERTWVISCVKGMENTASNAGITAEVLQEIMRVQDETSQRVDIRKVMHEIFNRAFAVV